MHEVQRDGNVNELTVATGGPHGGTNVDAVFQKILKKLWGIDYLTALQEDLPKIWWDIENRFEYMKRQASPKAKTTMNIFGVNAGMLRKYSKMFEGKDFAESFEKAKIPGVSLDESEFTFRLSPLALDAIFHNTVRKIVECVSTLMKKDELANMEYIFLVGGFSASEYLINAIRSLCSGGPTSVLIPQDPDLAVLKGAVLFGQRPDYVRTRIARKSYGIRCQEKFDPKRHKESNKITIEGVDKCRDVLLIYVKKNTPVELSNSVVKSFLPSVSTQTSIEFEFYSSSLDVTYRKIENDTPGTDGREIQEIENVIYTNDPETRKIGNLSIPLPNISRGKKRLVDVSFYFGGTQIKVTVKDMSVIDGEEKTLPISFIAS